MLKWKLWKIRNKIKFENLNFSVNQINENIVSKIKDATKFIEKKTTKLANYYVRGINMLKEFE